MRFGKTAAVIAAMLATLTATTLELGAGERLHRLTGHCWGDGYHVCNPGPDSSYYCPWSALNTPRPEFFAPVPNLVPATSPTTLTPHHRGFQSSTPRPGQVRPSSFESPPIGQRRNWPRGR